VLRNERPPVPPNMPASYQLLMTRCWQSDPMARPGFDTVLQLINLLIEELLQEGSDGGGGAGGGVGDEGGDGGGGASGSGALSGRPRRRSSSMASPASTMIQDL
jgi:uncharacterized membrane protein YgcG